MGAEHFRPVYEEIGNGQWLIVDEADIFHDDVRIALIIGSRASAGVY
jgi:hypothetical protein